MKSSRKSKREKGNDPFREGTRHRRRQGQTTEHVGLIYVDAGQTVSALQEKQLDPKQINLYIIVFPRKRSSEKLIVKVTRFKNCYGHGLYAIGRDTKKYDKLSISGNTRLFAYSY